MLKRAEMEPPDELGFGELSKSQIKSIVNVCKAIAIPKSAHQQVSPTYGGRNSLLINSDAKNLAAAAKRDTEAMAKELEKHGADERCVKSYRTAASEINKMTNDDYDEFIIKAFGD